jgi:hypothetical protein
MMAVHHDIHHDGWVETETETETESHGRRFNMNVVALNSLQSISLLLSSVVRLRFHAGHVAAAATHGRVCGTASGRHGHDALSPV